MNRIMDEIIDWTLSRVTVAAGAVSMFAAPIIVIRGEPTVGLAASFAGFSGVLLGACIRGMWLSEAR